MDTSETYIKMCEKAKGIQENWKPTMGDWVMVREKVEWDGYNLCVDAGETTVVLGIEERNYSSGNPIVGDVDDIAFYPECSWKGFDDTPKKNLIWLPRQDQLQEMVKDKYKTLAELILYFHAWAFPNAYTNLPNKPDSMEQLWLAFVMKEKYNKVRDGENWVKEKEE